MRIGIIGAGFTGLSAAYKLSKKGHLVCVFERDAKPGGLAVGFKKMGWKWSVEKAYHHWFTNDSFILNLVKEIGHNVKIFRPRTDILVNGEIFRFDSPKSILSFPYLSIASKLKFGMAIIYLKFLNDYSKLGGKTALSWIRRNLSDEISDLVWEPLFEGKFGKFKDKISLIWFWARIKKRTPKLAYPVGGFDAFAESLHKKIVQRGGRIFLETCVEEIRTASNKITVQTSRGVYTFDKVIVTSPTFLFAKIAKKLPVKYVKKITRIDHLHALSMMLILRKPFMKNTYWLNITDKKWPFLVIVEHTNFISSANYNKEHIVYIGCYLPDGHNFLSMKKNQLLKLFDPCLKKINPDYRKYLKSVEIFVGPFAQPIMTTDYLDKKPDFETPLKNVYLANLDMVYPWDRGTNYAIELGQEVARKIDK